MVEDAPDAATVEARRAALVEGAEREEREAREGQAAGQQPEPDSELVEPLGDEYKEFVEQRRAALEEAGYTVRAPTTMAEATVNVYPTLRAGVADASMSPETAGNLAETLFPDGFAMPQSVYPTVAPGYGGTAEDKLTDEQMAALNRQRRANDAVLLEDPHAPARESALRYMQGLGLGEIRRRGVAAGEPDQSEQRHEIALRLDPAQRQRVAGGGASRRPTAAGGAHAGGRGADGGRSRGSSPAEVEQQLDLDSFLADEPVETDETRERADRRRRPEAAEELAERDGKTRRRRSGSAGGGGGGGGRRQGGGGEGEGGRGGRAARAPSPPAAAAARRERREEEERAAWPAAKHRGGPARTATGGERLLLPRAQ